MKFKKILSAALSATLAVGLCVPTAMAAQPQNEVDQSITKEVFYDDFSGDTLDTSKWLVADKMWGGWNGGVVPENVSASDGTLKLEGHGNLYTGDVEGCNKNLPGGIRTGAAIATRDYYASGSYEVVAKVAPELGACSAIWTFEYEEYEKGVDPEYNNYPDQTGKYAIVNHEIDIELPTANEDFAEPTFHAARFNTYEMENRSNSHFTTLPKDVSDGQWHTYRFDWHTGDTNEQAHVDFYVDGQYLYTSTEHIPTNASRLWIGIWFPASKDSDGDGYGDTGWTGTANFDTTVFEIDSVKITPYCEAGDTVGKESYPKMGWANDSFPEDIEAENYEHVANGDFSAGKDGWTVNGDAKVEDGKAVLETGSVTRTFSQMISVQPKMTYTVKADVETDGTKVTLGVRKKNGEGNVSETYTSSGQKAFTFTTEASCKEMEVYVQVNRYQQGAAAKVDNISVKSGKDTTTVPITPVKPTPAPEPITPAEPTPTPSEKPAEGHDSLLGKDAWQTSGDAVMADGVATLTSGSKTDRATQSITVEGGKTYTLTADVETSGTEAEIGVNDYNGRYTNLKKTVTEDGKVSLTFTTANHIKTIEVYLQVLRYQNSNTPVTIKNISLVEGDNTPSTPEEPIPTPTPEPVEPTPTPSETPSGVENLLSNSSWKTSGDAVMEAGIATLTSGSKTDRATQKVKLEKGKTYKLTADVSASGTEVELGVNDYNGRYTNLNQKTNKNGQLSFTFTTASHIDTVEVYLQVLRYQTNNTPVTVSNIQLVQMN